MRSSPTMREIHIGDTYIYMCKLQVDILRAYCNVDLIKLYMMGPAMNQPMSIQFIY